MTEELNKYIKSTSEEMMRSEISIAAYNPRTITDEARKNLKRGIKKFGLVGGIIYNKRTGILVSGHQRLSVMDELNKYPDNDYNLRVDVIDVDEKSEKELNILLNNPKAMGDWDYDALREMIPDIDYKDAGLTDEDLSLIGVDFLLQTEAESSLADALDELNGPLRQQRQQEREAKQLSREERTAAAKETKAQIREEAEGKAQEMEAYVMLSFDNYASKQAFMRRFDFDPDDKFVKGEYFSEIIERVD